MRASVPNCTLRGPLFRVGYLGEALSGEVRALRARRTAGGGGDLLLVVYFLLLSKDSAAASLRSTCGSERRPPEWRTQRSPIPAPQVGQGMAANCFGVRS